MESKLEEALNCVTQQARLKKPTTISPDKNDRDDSNPRIDLLEQKYCFLMDQVSTLVKLCEVKNNTQNQPNPGAVFPCLDCEFEAASKSQLNSHIYDSHSRVYNCNKCDFTSTKSFEVREHKVKSHPIILLKCEECDLETQHSSQLEKHKRTMHKVPKYPCDLCSYKASHSTDLKRHQRSMHEVLTEAPEMMSRNSQYSCNSCSYNAIHDNDLRRHMHTMHAIPLSCTKCTYEAKSASELSLHIRNEHKQTRTFYGARVISPRKDLTSSSTKPGCAAPTPAPQSSPSSSSTSARFECHGPCSSLQKTFNQEDEFNLHMNFFHKEPQQ